MEKEKKTSIFDINLKRYLRLCLKNWYIFAICASVLGALMAGWTYLKPQLVTVMAQVIIKDSPTMGSSMMGELARSFSMGDMFNTSSSTDNETAMIGSYSVMLSTAKQLDLCTAYAVKHNGIHWVGTPLTSPVTLTPSPGIADTISTALVFDVRRLDNGNVNVKVKRRFSTLVNLKDQSLPLNIHTDYGDFVLNKSKTFNHPKYDTYRILFGSYSWAAQGLAKSVKVFAPDRKADFIDLTYTTSDPKFGEMVLDSIIKNYIALSNDYKVELSNQQLKLIDERLATLSRELKESDLMVESFKKNNNFTNMEADATYLIEKTGELESAILTAQTNFEIIKLKRDFLADPKNKYNLVPELEIGLSEEVEGGGSMIAQYNNMLLSRLSLQRQVTPDHKALKNLEENIDLIRGNIIASVENQYQNALLALNDLKKEDNKTKSRIGELPSIERDYLEIRRGSVVQHQLYIFLLQQREEKQMSLGSTTIPIQVVDPPYPLIQTSRLTPITAAICGFLLGCLLSAAYIFFIVMKKTPVSAKSEIDNASLAPILGNILHNTTDRGALAVAADTECAESLRHLRADVLYALKGCGGNTVAVTSVNDNEGTSFVSVNLAASLAMIGKKVLLVDANLRNPAICAALGVSNASDSLSKLARGLSSSASAETVKVGNMGATLDVIAEIKANPNAADIVASDGFARFIQTAKADYDYVIIDSPRIKGYSDIYYVTDLADMTLIVCRGGMTTPKDVDVLNDLYHRGRLKRMAVVKNDF